MIKVGDAIPSRTVSMLNDGIEPVATREFFAGRKIVLFGVPGAFTPTCSNKHLPGYIEHLTDFEQRAVTVACMAVNDAYVMRAWSEAQHVPNSLAMLADGNGSFARALGLDMDGSGFGMGRRARRFALYADDGIVKVLHVEAPGEFRVSSAKAMLSALDKSDR
jgi:peroxiredoxin